MLAEINKLKVKKPDFKVVIAVGEFITIFIRDQLQFSCDLGRILEKLSPNQTGKSQVVRRIQINKESYLPKIPYS